MQSQLENQNKMLAEIICVTTEIIEKQKLIKGTAENLEAEK